MKNHLNKIENRIRSIGFQEAGVQYIMEALNKVILLYLSPVDAARVLSENLEKFGISNLFSQKQFEIFLNNINPKKLQKYDELDFAKVLGCYEYELDCMPEERLSYYREKRDLVAKLIARRSSDFSLITVENSYIILKSKKYIPVDPDYHVVSIRPRIISTPFGGQPGYKKRR